MGNVKFVVPRISTSNTSIPPNWLSTLYLWLSWYQSLMSEWVPQKGLCLGLLLHAIPKKDAFFWWRCSVQGSLHSSLFQSSMSCTQISFLTMVSILPKVWVFLNSNAKALVQVAWCTVYTLGKDVLKVSGILIWATIVWSRKGTAPSSMDAVDFMLPQESCNCWDLSHGLESVLCICSSIWW
jgi:hypothetical protein